LSRPLDQLSPDELGRRFPVILSEYDPAWPARYSDEKACIERTLGSYIIRGISHIGSTSVPGLVAKPTIDILLEVREDADRDWLVRCFAAMEYGYIPQPNKPPPHLFFMKGYTQEGFRGQVFHVHVRYRGDWDERYFRDYLIRHPDTAWEYGELKRQLKKQCEFDRDAYTERKGEFVHSVVKEARKERGVLKRPGIWK
jgi:GrpB-like predicted nucleotidyltransferase (UPF0157 family)